MMKVNNGKAAHATGDCQSNDHRYPDEVIDDLASMFIRNARERIGNDPAVVFAEDFDLVRDIFQSFKSKLRDGGLSIADFSRMAP